MRLRVAVRSLLAVVVASVLPACAEPMGEPADGGDVSESLDFVPDDAPPPDADVVAEADGAGAEADDGGPDPGDGADDGGEGGPDGEAGADADVDDDAGPADARDDGADPGADADADGAPDAEVVPDADGDTGADAASGCVSGASGRLAVRFRWDGSWPGSTAYVRYEANDLPDTSRWRVTAASASIGYTPPFDDTYLGEGGLRLDGTAFIDVELSTSGLTAIDGVTISVYGRSFATTTSGSFTWQTFGGTGAAPWDLVSNVAPYEWYGADATDAFSPGDDGVLLRLRPGPSSDALIVRRVEVCFDAR